MRSEPLDAIRGLAISLVIACHYFDFDRGVAGVDLFFVLSGYLIGGMLLDSREQPAYFSSFYGRRAFRILPLYWLLLVIVPPAHWGYYLFFAQQIPWMQSGYPVHEPSFVTWSLAIEEQFCLILPGLIYWLPHRWLFRTLWWPPCWRQSGSGCSTPICQILPGSGCCPAAWTHCSAVSCSPAICVVIAAPLPRGECWPVCRHCAI